MPLLSPQKKSISITRTVSIATLDNANGTIDVMSMQQSKKNVKSNVDISNQYNKLVFQCQLAHGSPTCLISDFNSVETLYEKIAASFAIAPSTV
jgi:PDZ domain-containing protein GIPC